MYFIHFTQYSIHCIVYSAQCTLYSVQCTVYSVHAARISNSFSLHMYICIYGQKINKNSTRHVRRICTRTLFVCHNYPLPLDLRVITIVLSFKCHHRACFYLKAYQIIINEWTNTGIPIRQAYPYIEIN